MTAFIITLLLGLVTLSNALHIEVNNKYITNWALAEQVGLQAYFDRRFEALNSTHNLVFDWASLSTSNTKDTKNSIDFAYKASFDNQPFQVVATIGLVPTGEAGIYKHGFATTVKTSGLNNPELDSTVQSVLVDFFGNVTDWTHRSEVFKNTSLATSIAQFPSITLAKIAGVAFTNGNSIFLEFSAKDIHFSSKDASATTYYQKLDTKKQKYVGVTMNDKVLEDLLMEFFLRRQEFNLLELLSLFPDFDPVTEQMVLNQLEMLLPDVVAEYGSDKRVSVLMNSQRVFENDEFFNDVKTSIKTNFKKDTLEMMSSTAIELIVEKTPNKWVSVRYGYITFGVTITFKNTGDLQYFVKPVVSIKKLVLFQSSDDEDMETEAGAIIGITNLMLKKQLKNQTISLT